MIRAAAFIAVCHSAGCLPSPLPPGVRLKKQDVGFSNVFGTHRGRFDGPREVVTRDVDDLAVWGGHREWEATVDVVDGPRSWKTRCALRPVRNGVLVPNMSNVSVDPDPELVCWTLSDGAPFELAIVLERPLMTGYVERIEAELRLLICEVHKCGES